MNEFWSSSPLASREREDRRARPRMSNFDEESLFSLNFPPAHHVRKGHSGGGSRTNTTSSPPGRRKLIYRCFQVFSILIVGISLYALVENIKYLIQTYDGDELSSQIGSRFVNINEELQSWVIEKKEDDQVKSSTFQPPTTTSHTIVQKSDKTSKKPVLNINHISFDINNESLCKSTTSTSLKKNQLNGNGSSSSGGLYFMIIVHSAPSHFEARQAIRSSWGSIKSLKNVSFRLVFLTGKMKKGEEDPDEADLVQSSITRESEIFGDIVSGSFIDSYKNLTYKHLLSYKWANLYCPGSAFILKADDDAFIDIFQLFDFISRTYGLKPSPGTMICNVFPEGSKPVRASDTQGTKWAVTSEEYPHEIYPKYCGGLAYLVTPDVVKRILDVSDKVKFFWIDDVFVTGILREFAGVEPFYLNLRYSYEPERYRKWLNNNFNKQQQYNNSSTHHQTSTSSLSISQPPSKLPFMVTHVERGAKFTQEMNQLWRKTLKVWSKEFMYKN